MTDYQMRVFLQLIVDKLDHCDSLEDYNKAKEEIRRMKNDERTDGDLEEKLNDKK